MTIEEEKAVETVSHKRIINISIYGKNSIGNITPILLYVNAK